MQYTPSYSLSNSTQPRHSLVPNSSRSSLAPPYHNRTNSARSTLGGQHPLLDIQSSSSLSNRLSHRPSHYDWRASLHGASARPPPYIQSGTARLVPAPNQHDQKELVLPESFHPFYLLRSRICQFNTDLDESLISARLRVSKLVQDAIHSNDTGKKKIKDLLSTLAATQAELNRLTRLQAQEIDQKQSLKQKIHQLEDRARALTADKASLTAQVSDLESQVNALRARKSHQLALAQKMDSITAAEVSVYQELLGLYITNPVKGGTLFEFDYILGGSLGDHEKARVLLKESPVSRWECVECFPSLSPVILKRNMDMLLSSGDLFAFLRRIRKAWIDARRPAS